MIENDFVSYLMTDATLDAYLGSTASDGKIYPEFAVPKKTLPYITFSIGMGVEDEILDEERITFKIYCANKEDVSNILERMKTLLDVDDDIHGVVTSTNYYIYTSRLTYYETLPEFTEIGNPKFVGVATFNIKYAKK